MATFSFTRTKLNVNTTLLTNELTLALSGICLFVIVNADQVTMAFDYNLTAPDIIIMETVLANHVSNPASPANPIDPANPADSDIDLTGQLHQVLFCRESKVENKWLSTYGDGSMYSNSTPSTMPWRSKLVGITFMNSVESANTRLQMYSDAVDPGLSNTVGKMIFEWNLANIRSAQMMTIATPVIVEAGERIGIFARESKGRYPRNVNVMTYWQVIDATKVNNSQNYDQYIEIDYTKWSENHG